MIRNNLRRSHCSRPRGWTNFLFPDCLWVDAPLVVQGSNVFKSIWKAWKFVKNLLSNKDRVEKSSLLCGKKSIWWNLSHGDKKLALLQGFSTKKWSELGISIFEDIILEDFKFARRFYLLILFIFPPCGYSIKCRLTLFRKLSGIFCGLMEVE